MRCDEMKWKWCWGWKKNYGKYIYTHRHTRIILRKLDSKFKVWWIWCEVKSSQAKMNVNAVPFEAISLNMTHISTSIFNFNISNKIIHQDNVMCVFICKWAFMHTRAHLCVGMFVARGQTKHFQIVSFIKSNWK